MHIIVLGCHDRCYPRNKISTSKGISGSLGVSAYCFKHPPVHMRILKSRLLRTQESTVFYMHSIQLAQIS